MTKDAARFDAAAARWSDEAYADAAAYLAHRAELILALGPRLEPGDAVLDLACGDGGVASFLPGLRYHGVDTSAAMVDAARSRGVAAEVGDLNEYEPAAPVAATTIFRALYYARDRLAFFRRAAGFTEKKLVLDLNPRQYRLGDVRRDLEEAGFRRLETRPFLVPQSAPLPAAAVAALERLEQVPPLAWVALRFRFTYVCAAFR